MILRRLSQSVSKYTNGLFVTLVEIVIVYQTSCKKLSEFVVIAVNHKVGHHHYLRGTKFNSCGIIEVPGMQERLIAKLIWSLGSTKAFKLEGKYASFSL